MALQYNDCNMFETTVWTVSKLTRWNAIGWMTSKTLSQKKTEPSDLNNSVVCKYIPGIIPPKTMYSENPPNVFLLLVEGRGLEANRSESRKKSQAKKGLGQVGPSSALGPSLLVSKGRANVSYSNQPQHGKAAVGIETNLVFWDIYQFLAMDPPTFVSTFLAAKWSLTLCITIGWIMLDRYCWLNVKRYII